MKKLLAILVLGSFVACNSAETDTTTDTTNVVTPAPIDTVVTPIDTTMTPVDTTGTLNN